MKLLLALLLVGAFVLAACSSTPTTPKAKAVAPKASASLPHALSSPDCGADVSLALNTWLASRPPNTTVTLPYHACYVVSNTPYSGQVPYPNLTLSDLSNLTINGNGATFIQTSYNGGSCSTDVNQHVLTLTADTNITFKNLTIEGPSMCGGSGTEGGVGVFVGAQGNSHDPDFGKGNTNITFSGVTVEDTAGDGMDIYPDLGTGVGINTNISFVNSAMNHIGYHVFVPEGVTGLKITGDTFTDTGDFMDLEVDNNYGPPFNTCNDTYAEGLTGNAQCNITVSSNHFVSSHLDMVSVSNGQCIPMGNMKINNNRIDVNSTMSLLLMGSEPSTDLLCPQDNNLQIENNIAANCAPLLPSSMGSCGLNTGEALNQIAQWKNVTISGNQFLANTGSPGRFNNALDAECVAAVQDANVHIERNGCNGTNNVWDDVSFQFPPAEDIFANIGIVNCGNVYGLTKPIYQEFEGTWYIPAANPEYDTAC